MLAELAAVGVAPRDCVAKIFGGGNMFPSLVGRDGDVGRRNGEVARAQLAKHGIPLLSQCLYGIGHRRIQFDISNGDVWSRQDKPTAIEPAGVIQLRMPRDLSALPQQSAAPAFACAL